MPQARNDRMHIKAVRGRQIIDSRGKPTIEVEVTTADDAVHRAAVPSGASTGVHEALELRDGDKAHYLGQGVLKAVSNVNQIIGPQLLERGFDVRDQAKIDRFLLDLDGTANKANLGANAILGVSLAVAIAGAHAKGIPLYRHIAELAETRNLSLPVPAFNIINGGAHAGNPIPFQEFMVIPSKAASFSEAMQVGSEIYAHLKNILKKTYGQNAVNVGDEGGFAPDIETVDKCLDLITEAVKVSGHEGKVKIGLDVAASEFYKGERGYNLNFKKEGAGVYLRGPELAKLYQDLVHKYPIVSIEDAFEQDDFDSWSHFNSQTSVQLVGDDLTVTNIERIQVAIDKNACNALLLKVNQIGTLTESIQAAKLAQRAGWNVMVSHRSGETEDTFIADLAVGLGAGQIKSGAPCRSERLAKYNRLLRIEEELGNEAALARPAKIA